MSWARLLPYSRCPLESILPSRSQGASKPTIPGGGGLVSTRPATERMARASAQAGQERAFTEARGGSEVGRDAQPALPSSPLAVIGQVLGEHAHGLELGG